MIDERLVELQLALDAAQARFDAAQARAQAMGDYVLLESPVSGPGGQRLRDRQKDPRRLAAHEYREADAALVAARGALKRHIGRNRVISKTRSAGTPATA